MSQDQATFLSPCQQLIAESRNQRTVAEGLCYLARQHAKTTRRRCNLLRKLRWRSQHLEWDYKRILDALLYDGKEERMIMKGLFTPQEALEYYTELQRRVRVGAYLELELDGSFPPDDGTPESTTLESLHNLEVWADQQGLEFVWDAGTKQWDLAAALPLHGPSSFSE